MWDPQYSLLVHQMEEFKQELDNVLRSNTNHRSMKIHDFSCNSPVKRDIIETHQSLSPSHTFGLATWWSWSGRRSRWTAGSSRKTGLYIRTVVTRYWSPKCCRMSRKSIWRVPKLLWEEFCRITVQCTAELLEKTKSKAQNKSPLQPLPCHFSTMNIPYWAHI